MSLYKVLTKTTAICGLAALAFTATGALNTSVNAAGVAVSLAPLTRTVSTTGSVTLTFTPAAALPTGSTLSVNFSNAYTGGAALTDASVTTTGTNITSTVESGFTATGFTSTLTNSAPVTGLITMVINGLTSPAAAGNYSFLIFTSAGDLGGALQYVGNANEVQVRAFVPATLSFAIRNSADNANINVCDMGNLTTAAIGTCAYRLKIGTNAGSGYSISVSTSGNLTNGANSFANAAAGATGTALVAGTERYGVNITPGSVTSALAVTTATSYAAGTNAVSYVNTVPALLLTSAGSNSPVATDLANTTLVTHNAAISQNTGAGQYTQTVTYTVSPSF